MARLKAQHDRTYNAGGKCGVHDATPARAAAIRGKRREKAMALRARDATRLRSCDQVAKRIFDGIAESSLQSLPRRNGIGGSWAGSIVIQTG